MMAQLRRIPAVHRVPIAPLRCEGCGAAPAIFSPSIPLRCWCSPACAADSGLEPWASADLVVRATWPDRIDAAAI